MDEILTENHQRKTGRRGCRHLLLRIIAGGRTQEELSLHQIWTSTDEGVESTVLVEPGSTLSGAQVSIHERTRKIELAVEVSVPGSQRSFSVGAPFDTFVFGSEFTYEDFRFFLPPGEIKPHSGDDNRCCWVVNYLGVYARHFVDLSMGIPITSEWFRGSDNRPFRIVSSVQFREISGVMMPSIMNAQRSDTQSGEQSCMLLGDVIVES